MVGQWSSHRIVKEVGIVGSMLYRNHCGNILNTKEVKATKHLKQRQNVFMMFTTQTSGIACCVSEMQLVGSPPQSTIYCSPNIDRFFMAIFCPLTDPDHYCIYMMLFNSVPSYLYIHVCTAN